jgi:hypothetical protein
METEALPKTNGNGAIAQEERAVGKAVLWIWHSAKTNWKALGIIGALFLNSPKANAFLDEVMGWNLPTGSRPPAALIMDAPVGEDWKSSVNRRLGVLEAQNKKIIDILTRP